MKCLTSAQVQAVVDGEAPAGDRVHAAACERCRHDVAERRLQMAEFTADLDGIELPTGTTQRVEAAIARGADARGATRLRPEHAARGWLRRAWGTAALVAATILAMVFIAPIVKEDRGAVSAAEVLAASASRLAQTATTGVEILEYELVLDGVPKDLMPDHANGVYRVRQVIDHRTPGRFRFASYGPDGEPVSSIAQDPVKGERVMMFHLDDQVYRFEVAVPSDVGPSLPEMERLHMEATIAMMQASGDQHLEVVDTPDGRQYRIEVPKVNTPLSGRVWDLSEARVLIDADDYRVTELSVKGTFLKQPYSILYRLHHRGVAANVNPDLFDIPSEPNEIVISGTGTVIPARDVMVLALRELAKAKQAR